MTHSQMIIASKYAIMAQSKPLPPIKHMIVINGVDVVNNDTPEQIIHSLAIGNEWLKKENIEFVRQWQVTTKKRTYKNIVVALSPIEQIEAIKRGKLRFRLFEHTVWEYFDTIQCKNCWRFGHLRHQCKFQHACRICGENHSVEACISKKPKCANCLRFNAAKGRLDSDKRSCAHRPTDRTCPDFRSRVSGLKSFWADQ